MKYLFSDQVLWDNGVKQNYRVGHCNAYDLRLLDNGPCGVYHSQARCEACGTRYLPAVSSHSWKRYGIEEKKIGQCGIWYLIENG